MAGRKRNWRLILVVIILAAGCTSLEGVHQEYFGQVQLQAAELMDMDVVVGLGNLSLKGGNSMAGALEFTYEAVTAGDAPEVVYQPEKVQPSLLFQQVAQQVNAGVMPVFDLLISPVVPLSLRVKLGLGENRLDLSNIDIRTLDVLTAGGTTVVDLRSDQTKSMGVVITSGVGQTIVYLPNQQGVIAMITGDVSVIANGFAKVDQTYVNAVYSHDKPVVKIQINGTGGEVQLIIDDFDQIMIPAALDCKMVGALDVLAQQQVPVSGEGRLKRTRAFFDAAQDGYGYGVGYGFGRGQIDFTKWETARGVLDEKDGSGWWQAANGQLLKDMLLAKALYENQLADCPGTSTAVKTWLAYMEAPSGQAWYAAHNASIVFAYQQFERLAFEESLAEQIVIANTLYRVTLADFMVIDDNLVTPVMSDPRGPAVGLITSVDRFYPQNYPLNADQAEQAALLYLVENNPIQYAEVTAEKVVEYLLVGGFDQAQIETLFVSDTNLYQELFPGFSVNAEGTRWK